MTEASSRYRSAMTPTQVWTTAVVTAAASVALGGILLPVAFFFAYAFQDPIGVGQHAVFLTGVLVAAGVTAGIAWVVAAAATGKPRAAGVVVGAATATTYATALAVGTLVCFAYESQGSVTADQPSLPFVALVGLCLVVAAVGVRALPRAGRPSVSRG
ncbi:putative membrane protein [Aeromicrobium sp. SORGH_AS981]|nr:putative membrane protein [Aeromicrobium sp. SORGH_AS_0981]